jgi:hypothetical protein
MIAQVVLCVLSSFVFCLCARGLVAVATSNKRPVSLAVSGRRGFSMSAWRLARAYMSFALAILTALAFAGACVSYFELFTLKF